MAAPVPVPHLALRGSEGLWMFNGPPQNVDNNDFESENGKTCRGMVFTADGSLFAWNNGKCVTVMDLVNYKVLCQINKGRTVFMMFSPKGNYLATWEPYTTMPGEKIGKDNMTVWSTTTGEVVKSFITKSQESWNPQWTDDETICGRIGHHEVHLYEDNTLETIVHRLHLQNLAGFAISRSINPYYIAAYVPGKKGQPSFVRIFKYPNFNAVLANKSFFKADKVDMQWNPNGTALLILASVEFSADSYYGEQGLHYLGIDGTSSLIPLAKNGPVYHIEWNPNSTEFCVVYGFMPAKATLYNMKCEPVFDFGTGPRNLVYYNPFGNILCLAGFGNLRGNMELWDTKQKKLISKAQADDTTYFQWCPDGEHFVTATCAPKLRQGNGYKVWHYTGKMLHEQTTPTGQELWEVIWRPAKKGVYSARPVRHLLPSEIKEPNMPGANIPQVYRPPSARGQPTAIKIRADYEAPSNAKQQENLSKAALKNKKKREAKARAKQQNEAVQEEETATSQAAAPVPNTGDPDKDKKIRNLRKKLEQVQKLKQQQKEGKKLEINQLEKIKTEDAIIKDLNDLEIG